MNCDILVSVICTVYNHERYLRQTLEGIVTQKTTFKFEAIVHDDCSTDGSEKIIKEYEEKYPEIIKAVYQKENQYSKGINIFNTFMKPQIKGKYCAICEGDDFWTDVFKLEKQVSYMETHPDCTFCFTNAIIHNVQNGKKRLMIPYLKSDSKNITRSGDYNLVQLARVSFIPYASFFFPTRNYSLFPDYYYLPVWAGDRKTALFSTALGYAHFIDEPTCCYHYGVAGSAMTTKKSKSTVAKIERSFVELNNRIDLFSGYTFTDFFKEDNLKYLRNIMMLTGDKSLLSPDELLLVYNNDSLKTRVARFFVKNMPEWLFNWLRTIKRKLFV